MNLPIVVTSCLAWSLVAFGIRTINHYNAQSPAQKMNQYWTWLDDSPQIRPSPYGSRTDGSTMSKHYPMSASRYHVTKSGGNRQLLSSDDYNYDTDAIANPSRSHNRLDYAAVKYPIYSGGDGTGDYYYPATNVYDGPSYEDNTTPLDRYELTRYPPTDNVLEFYDVFTSNVMSPSNAFKSAEERQLYKFWQFLINGDDDEDDYDNYEDPQQRPSLESDMVSRPYEYHVMQKLMRKQQPPEEQTPLVSPPFSPSAGLSQAVLRSNVYKLWKNGLPLVKRSIAKGDLKRVTPPLDDDDEDDGDDVDQLDNLKTAYVAVPRVTGGREERAMVMPPEPADEELSSEQIPKSIAQSDQQGYLNKNAAIASAIHIKRIKNDH